MSVPALDETIFVSIEIPRDAYHSDCYVVAAHVTGAIAVPGEFEFYLVGYPGTIGARRVSDEGLTWARAAEADLLRVTVSL